MATDPAAHADQVGLLASRGVYLCCTGCTCTAAVASTVAACTVNLLEDANKPLEHCLQGTEQGGEGDSKQSAQPPAFVAVHVVVAPASCSTE
jgi:hypothetical protein